MYFYFQEILKKIGLYSHITLPALKEFPRKMTHFSTLVATISNNTTLSRMKLTIYLQKCVLQVNPYATLPYD